MRKERCSCGATIEADSLYYGPNKHFDDAAKEWRTTHVHEMPRVPEAVTLPPEETSDD